MNTPATSPIIGRSAVYTKVVRKVKDPDAHCAEYVEVSRTLYRGVIVDLVVLGSQVRYLHVVMLYPDGSIRTHDHADVTVEADPEPGPYR